MAGFFPSPTKVYHTDAYPEIDPSLPQLSTKGKTIVITGAGTGVGRATAEKFAQSGATNVAILGRTEKTLLETKQHLNATYPDTKVLIYVADLTDPDALQRAFAGIASAAGPVDVLVANAGYLPTPGTLAESDPDEWFSGFEINVKGNYNLVRAFLPHAAKGAAVVHLSTGIVHMNTMPFASAYHISKAAAAKIFDYLRSENEDLFVVNVHPGVHRTAMTARSQNRGVKLPYDEIDLPGSFIVWVVSPEARFLNGKFVWAHWDVNELKAMKETLQTSDRFTVGLLGWP